VCYRSHQMAMLCWKTDEPADARIDFGAAPGTLDHAETRSTLQLVQSVMLTGLSPDTVYYYSARSADGSGNAAQSAIASLRTDTLPDTTPPVFVKAPQVVYASADRVVIEWETDEPTQAVIEWGPNAQRALRVYEPGGTTRHQLTLTNLLANTEYFVRVVASDAAGNSTQADVP